MINPLGVVVLAGGLGSRMQSSVPKLLQPLGGAPMIEYVLDACRNLQPFADITAVVSGNRNGDQIEAFIREYSPEVLAIRQKEPKGTGDAVLSSAPLFKELIENDGDLLVVMGDVPLVTPLTLSRLVAHHRKMNHVATILTMDVQNPEGYGRIIAQGRHVEIREDADADDIERYITEVNTGVLIFKAAPLFEVLPLLNDDNASHEIYLSEAMNELGRYGVCARLQVMETVELPNINTFEQLADSDKLIRRRLLSAHMKNGVRILDPLNCYIEKGVQIGTGTTIFPFSVIRRGVVIGKNCEVGPFAHLREGTVLDDNCVIGNFVESKNTHLGENTKAKHLSYLGDLTTGKDVNIGAGTIVCNYDGKEKHPSKINDGASIGAGTMMVAPCEIGSHAQTGAGAVVTHDVKSNEKVVGVPAKPIKKERP
jgi:bifunctional UDP-N-acetylglucosamine pyrophosphorylase/glucosamine-1-phosphate N-acetyltransferase